MGSGSAADRLRCHDPEFQNRSLGVGASRPTRCEEAGLGWPQPPDLAERLYGRPAGPWRSERRAAIDFETMRKELAGRKGLTAQRL